MPSAGTLFLMYHELELGGRSPCQSEPGYFRYVLPEATFRAQVDFLQNAGLRGVDVSEALTFTTANAIAITFDDGCETDLLAAAPILKQANFGATFYITAGFLGRRGYLSDRQLRELSDQGFEIGCHSMTHPYLSDLSSQELQPELTGAKIKLEQITGRQVRHFSCPGGRWDKRVADLTQEAGYRSMATSQVQLNSSRSDPFALGRVAITRETGLDLFQKLCRGQGLWKLQLRDATRSTAKRLFGNSAYDRIRSLLLHRPVREQ